ncbi:MAG: hypothetical protein WC510_03075 [Candidatus Omnitrophota bacterium]
MRGNQDIIVFTIFALLCVFIIGCGKHKIESRWRDGEISIDGKSDEWKDSLAYYDENTRVNIGVMNDDTYLYVCLITRNHGLMEQLLRSGFTVWFDPKGGNNKVLGIHFPSGGGMMPDNGMPAMGRGREDLDPPDKKSPERPTEMFQEPWQEVEIIGPGEEERYKTTVEAAEKYGINVKIGKEKGYFVYELKVPLFENEQYPYAIRPNKDRLIGLGFETSGSGGGMSGSGGRRGMGMPGGGMSFGGGGMGRPGGGGPGGGGPPSGRGGMGMAEEEKSFQLWLIVVLAGGVK